MKSAVYLLTAVLLTTAFFSSCDFGPLPEETVYAVFPENFDTTAVADLPAGWIYSMSEGAVQSPAAVMQEIGGMTAASSPNYLHLQDASVDLAARAIVNVNIHDSGYGQLTFKFQTPDYSDQDGVISIRGANSTHVNLRVKHESTVTIEGLTGEETVIASFNDDEWNTGEIKWDKATGNSQIIINGVDCGIFPMLASSPLISRIKIIAGTTTTTGGTLFIDDVNLTTNEEQIGDLPVYAAFPENFDTTAVGELPAGWTYSETEGDSLTPAEVKQGTAGAPGYSSPNYLCLQDASADPAVKSVVNTRIHDSNFGQLTFYLRIPSTPASDSTIYLKGSSVNFVELRVRERRTFEIRDINSRNIEMLNYAFDTWYKVQINWDKNSGYFNFLVNDQYYGTFALPETTEAIERIKFVAGGTSASNAALYIDDVNLTINTVAVSAPPAPAGFSENFDSVAVGSLPVGFVATRLDSTLNAQVINNASPAAPSGSNCLQLSETSTTTAVQVRKIIGEHNYGQLQVQYMGLSGMQNVGFIKVRTMDNDTLFTVCINEEGQVWMVNDNTGVATLAGTVTLNAWHEIFIEYDRVTGYYSVTVDGSLLLTLGLAYADMPAKIDFQAGNTLHEPTTMSAYFDTVVFTVNTVTVTP